MGVPKPPGPPPDHVLMFAIICLGIIVLNGIVFPIGMTPDSYSYLRISEEIAGAWRNGGSLLDSGQKFRILGYPALIALLELGFGPRPFLAVYVLQGVLVVTTGVVLFWTLLRLGVASLVAAALSLLYITALPTMLASYLLTDTISNSLTAIVVCLLAEPLFKPVQPTLLRVLGAGILMGTAFFFREANQYLIVCLLPFVAVIAWQRRKLLHGVLLIFALMAPVMFASEAYKAFNIVRFDQRIVTTIGRLVMLGALLPLAERKPELFDGTSELDRVARANFSEYTFAENNKINGILLRRGYSEERLSKEAFAKYFEAWRRYPFGMARATLERMRFDKQARELLNPPLAFNTNARWRSQNLAAESKRVYAALNSGDVKEFLTVLPVMAGRIPSLAIYLFVLLGSPVVMIMAWRRNDTILALGLAALLTSYLGYALAYALVHMEMRYLGGISVILVLSASVSLQAVSQWAGWRWFDQPDEER